MATAELWIEKLGLKPHPEGGFYNEIYKSEEKIKKEGLPERYSGKRSFITTIYFLLKTGQVSKFHCLQSDEIWYYHSGNPVKVYLINNNSLSEQILGNSISLNYQFQVIVPKFSWFAAEPLPGNENYSLFGCAVAPGFEFEDFKLGNRKELIKYIPKYGEIIKKFT